MTKRYKNAQIFLEYILVIGVITGVMIVMSTTIKRFVQSMVKSVADQVGFQENSDQEGGQSGYMQGYTVETQRDQQTLVRERLGNTTYVYQTDRQDSQTDLLTNLGYTNKE